MGQRATQACADGSTCDGRQRQRQKSICAKGQPKGCWFPRGTTCGPEGSASSGVGYACCVEVATRAGATAGIIPSTNGRFRYLVEFHATVCRSFDHAYCIVGATPREVPIHAQSQKLQWKVNKKTRQVSDLKGKIIADCRYLKGLQSQYEKASEVLDQLRAQWQKIGPALIEPPSPLKSETEQTDAEESQESGQDDPEARMMDCPDDQNEWRQP